MQAEIKKSKFLLNDDAKKAFDFFRAAFQHAFILTHFNSQLRIKLKTNASNFEIANIISQLQAND